ncbi:MAG: hypothetical protein QOJ62_312 [Actinomycetota bacterium]|jgi:uncharacterized protein YcnI|nr:hypothetical protein [Actinomycetota bacterium]
MSRITRRLLSAGVLSGALLAATAGPALAHVTVNANGAATQGGYAKLTVRVPTESDTASTTKVQLVLPLETPMASVAVKPHTGWTYTVHKAKLDKPITSDDGQVTEAVSDITWTADSADSAIKPGQFDEFDLSVGPLPAADSMTFKALQTYSDGTVVRWIEVAAAGAAEPSHPAPVLHLATAATTGSTTTPNLTVKQVTEQIASATKDASSSSAVTGALVLAGVALVVGLASGIIGMLALRRRSAAHDVDATPAPELVR